jgi:hypothetical protein
MEPVEKRIVVVQNMPNPAGERGLLRSLVKLREFVGFRLLVDFVRQVILQRWRSAEADELARRGTSLCREVKTNRVSVTTVRAELHTRNERP